MNIENIDSINGMELAEVPTPDEKQLLISLVYTSTLDESEREDMIAEINSCLSYTLYAAMTYKLEMLQRSIDESVNPSYKQIKELWKKKMNHHD